MNNDEHGSSEGTKPAIEPALEARLLAWVAGEATDAEQAELAALVAARPELAGYKQRMEVVRELVSEAVRVEPEPLRLSPERRAKLLKTLGGNFDVLPLREKIVVPPPKPKWWNGRHRAIYFATAGIAAGWVCALVYLAGFARWFTLHSSHAYTSRSRRLNSNARMRRQPCKSKVSSTTTSAPPAMGRA
jgi:hypothetical protein